ncbi:hypothetical protein Xaut_3261 [Xanthobacter versatilis]|uniref:Uncharacterized protein n=1 Tax=Xanthobacter autotrophicus (strain ATCC BAA-1158 / Py2) TaxID=78245 RepID=A7IKE7_XANP2|nr:hypothetical protein Xaut_3261 [Xanthobacter autotrophicus Py2]
MGGTGTGRKRGRCHAPGMRPRKPEVENSETAHDQLGDFIAAAAELGQLAVGHAAELLITGRNAAGFHDRGANLGNSGAKAPEQPEFAGRSCSDRGHFRLHLESGSKFDALNISPECAAQQFVLCMAPMRIPYTSVVRRLWMTRKPIEPGRRIAYRPHLPHGARVLGRFGGG